MNKKLDSSSALKAPRAKKVARVSADVPKIDGLPVVVGIGASAGGLEAFSKLLGALPTDTGMAFVLVQHLDPTHESLLTELLGRTTVLPVSQIEDGSRVAANHVHVIPPNVNLTLKAGVLRLSQRSAERGSHRPIDDFGDVQARGAAQQFGQQAFMRRIEVLHQHERHAGIQR